MRSKIEKYAILFTFPKKVFTKFLLLLEIVVLNQEYSTFFISKILKLKPSFYSFSSLFSSSIGKNLEANIEIIKTLPTTDNEIVDEI